MPTQEETFRRQVAVMWERSATDNHGNPTVSSPVEIRVRWEQTQGQTLNPDSQPVRTLANVVLDQDLDEGSILWLGRLQDLPASPTPLYEVVEFKKTPDVKGRRFRRVAKVNRYSNTLPTID